MNYAIVGKCLMYTCLCFTIFLIMPETNFPSFEEGMTSTNTYKANFEKIDHWRISKEIYEDFVNNPDYQSSPKIPKIIHQIWVGSPFPQKYASLQESWKKHHPDWEYRLWTDKDIEALGLINQNLYNKSSNMGEKSDIARLEILYRFGGLYIDTDFECLKPFDYLHHTCSFYAGFLYPRSPEMFDFANGLMGSIAGHPVLKECIDTMNQDTNDNSHLGIMHRTGPFHVSACYHRLLLQKKLSRDSVILPTNFFYAFPAWERFEKKPETIRAWLKKYSLAIHYWHCSWQEGH